MKIPLIKVKLINNKTLFSLHSLTVFVQGLPGGSHSLKQLNTQYQLSLLTMIDTIPLEAPLSNVSHQSVMHTKRKSETKGTIEIKLIVLLHWNVGALA